MRPGATLRDRRRLVLLAVVAIAISWFIAVPQGGRAEVDQRSFVGVIERMRHGTGYYEAFRDSFLDEGIRVSQGRGFRMPTTFLLWRMVPSDLLYPAFLTLVVVGTSWLLLRLTERPLLVLPVTLYLLQAGVTLNGWGEPPTDAWLLQEMWALPLVCGSVLAWRREWWRTAALIAASAVLVREITLPLLLGGLLASHFGKGPRWPWLATLVGVGGLVTLHWKLAAGAALAMGNEAPLLGSGRPPESILEMMDWPIPGPLAIGAVLWGAALVWVRRRGELAFLGPYFAIGLSGLVVRRPYWGVVFVPLTILFSLELVSSTVWPVPPAALVTTRPAGKRAPSGPSPEAN